MKERIFSTHQTIANKVTDYLKYQLIGSGKFEGEDFLREGDLAKSLKISRAPVREALQHLESIGLVRNIPRKGVQVRKLSSEEIEELYELRILLEDSVFELIIKENLLTPQVKERLKSLLDDLMDICDTETDRSSRNIRFCKKNLEFHQSLADLAGRPWTSKILSEIYSQLHLVMIPQIEDIEDLKKATRLHYSILEWLEKGDMEKLYN